MRLVFPRVIGTGAVRPQQMNRKIAASMKARMFAAIAAGHRTGHRRRMANKTISPNPDSARTRRLTTGIQSWAKAVSKGDRPFVDGPVKQAGDDSERDH